MAGEIKMLPPNITVLWVPLENGIADINAPQAEELVFTLDGGIEDPGPAYNITCAITQSDFTANFTERDTNDDKSLCDDSNVATPIYKNYEVALTAFRDANIENNESVYNLFYGLFRKPLQPGYIVTRIGKLHDEPFVDGDDVQVFEVLSGDPQNVHNDGEPVKMTVNFFPQGSSSNGYVAVGGES